MGTGKNLNHRKGFRSLLRGFIKEKSKGSLASGYDTVGENRRGPENETWRPRLLLQLVVDMQRREN